MIQKTNPKNWEIEYNYYKDNLYYSDISDKDEYMKKYGIRFDTLSNGIRLFGAVSTSSDRRSARTSLMFERGSLLDPDGKEGLHHLYEHLASSNDFIHFAGIHNTNRNASTSTCSLKLLLLNGPWNFKYPEYGNLEIFKRYLENELFQTKHITENLLFREKKVITGEIEQDYLKVSRLLGRKERELFYGKDSNVNIETLGTTETLNNINLLDIKNIPEKLLGTNNLFIGLYVTGTKKDFNVLYHKYYTLLEKIHTKIVEDRSKEIMLDFTNFSEFPKTLEIEVPSFDKGLSEVYLNFVLPVLSYTKESTCLMILVNIFQTIFFTKFRQYNIESYRQYISSKRLDYKYIQFYVGCKVKISDIEQAKGILQKSLYDMLDDIAFLKQAIKFKLLDELATPTPISAVLETFVDDIVNYKDIFCSFDKYSEIKQKLTFDDFVEVITIIRNSPFFFETIRQKD